MAFNTPNFGNKPSFDSDDEILNKDSFKRRDFWYESRMSIDNIGHGGATPSNMLYRSTTIYKKDNTVKSSHLANIVSPDWQRVVIKNVDRDSKLSANV